MKKWIINKLAKPLLPVLIQAYTVLLAAETALNEVLEKINELGIPADTPIYDNIKKIITATIAVKMTVVKTVKFLGGNIPSAHATSHLNLEEELEKLKSLM